jgi:hypothetical protein
MRWFLCQTICILTNITEASLNYYNKLETVGMGDVCGNRGRLKRAHLGDEERVQIRQASNASLYCLVKYRIAEGLTSFLLLLWRKLKPI